MSKKMIVPLVALVLALCAVLIMRLPFMLGNPKEQEQDNDKDTHTSTTTDDTKDTQSTDVTQSADVTDATEIHYEPISVTTPYGTFTYSGEWEEYMQVEVVEGDAGAVKFSALMDNDQIPLFDIYFDQTKGEMLGYTTTTTGDQVSVSMEVYDIPVNDAWTDEEHRNIYGMQSVLNDVVAQLSLSDHAAVSGEDIVIETSFCVLRYPNIWSDYLETEVKDSDSCVISFYCKLDDRDQISLFDISIGGAGDTFVDTLTTKDGKDYEVYLTTYDFSPDESWDESEQNVVFGMLEDLNYVFSALEEDGYFNN